MRSGTRSSRTINHPKDTRWVVWDFPIRLVVSYIPTEYGLHPTYLTFFFLKLIRSHDYLQLRSFGFPGSRVTPGRQKAYGFGLDEAPLLHRCLLGLQMGTDRYCGSSKRHSHPQSPRWGLLHPSVDHSLPPTRHSRVEEWEYALECCEQGVEKRGTEARNDDRAAYYPTSWPPYDTMMLS